MKKIAYSIILFSIIIVIISIISLLIYNAVDLNFINPTLFIVSIIFFLASFPFHRVLYHGGRVSNNTYTTQIPPDEHLQHKLQKTLDPKEKEKNFRGVFLLTSLLCFLLLLILSR